MSNADAVTTILNTMLEQMNMEIDSNVLAMVIDEASVFIQNYCNITKIPYEMRYIHANIVIDMLEVLEMRSNVGNTGETDGETSVGGVANISSIQLGDMNVRISDNTVANQRSKLLDYRKTLTDKYANDLNNFRQFCWG